MSFAPWQTPPYFPTQQTPNSGGLQNILGSPQMQQFALQLLANSGYSPVKRGFGEIAAQSMLQAQASTAQQRDEELRRKFMEAQIAKMQAPSGPNSQFGVVSPSDFTPASLEKFKKTGNYEDLVRDPSGGMGRYNPGQYTPESWARFLQTGEASVLERYVAPAMPTVQTVAGAQEVITPSRTGGAPSRVPLSTLPEETAAAAALEKAKTEGTGSGEQTTVFNKKAIGAKNTIKDLELAEPLIDAATGSLVGAGRDKLAAAFGKAPDGAQAIAQLKVLQASLMTNMPRMEGPQSDRDVQLYREAAGQIGDPTVPPGIKKAAVQMIRAIQQKYLDGSAAPGALEPGQSTTIGGAKVTRKK